jgi:hypothetical protein
MIWKVNRHLLNSYHYGWTQDFRCVWCLIYAIRGFAPRLLPQRKVENGES